MFQISEYNDINYQYNDIKSNILIDMLAIIVEIVYQKVRIYACRSFDNSWHNRRGCSHDAANCSK